MTRKVELWAKIIREKAIDLSLPVSRVTASDIKRITHEEPRLMAKMDTLEDLSSVLRKNGVFLLPISRTEYAIVKGNGYHMIETITENEVHETQYSFPTVSKGVESEGVYLDYALSSGILGRFTGVQNLHLAFRGRRTTPRFSFTVGTSTIEVVGAQIEVDGGYESASDEVILNVEAKLGIPSSFNIRQLYYPFRTFFDGKTVRNLFFCYEQTSSTYLLWEYDFNPTSQLDAIELRKAKSFSVAVRDPVTTRDYSAISATSNEIPQADSVDKIVQFPFKVAEGYDTSEKIKDFYKFTQRQSSYYRQAVEILGLVALDRNKYRLTGEGERYLKLPTEKRIGFVCQLLLRYRLMNDIFLKISTDPTAVVTKEEVTSMIKASSRLTGTTPDRRAQTTLAWFRWIQNHLGIVRVDESGSIRATQTRMDR